MGIIKVVCLCLYMCTFQILIMLCLFVCLSLLRVDVLPYQGSIHPTPRHIPACRSGFLLLKPLNLLIKKSCISAKHKLSKMGTCHSTLLSQFLYYSSISKNLPLKQYEVHKGSGWVLHIFRLKIRFQGRI